VVVHRLPRPICPRALLGDDEATTLMAALGPGSWDELATRADLALTRAELREEMAAQTRTIVLAMIASNATLVALAFAAARFAG
jgi:hypothetical protein